MKRMQTQQVVPGRRGFSLIELLIVLAILVLLASLVAPRLLGSRDQAQIDATKTQINMFKQPLELYSLAMGSYPSTEQGLQALIERPAADSGAGGDDDFGSEDDFGDGGEDLADLGGDDEDGLSEDGGGSDSNWDGPYLKADKLPKDPWGTAYRYEYPGRNNKVGEPDIWSLGPDRKDNTDDDITSWGSSKRSGEGGIDGEDGADGFEVGGGDGGGEELSLDREGE